MYYRQILSSVQLFKDICHRQEIFQCNLFPGLVQGMAADSK